MMRIKSMNHPPNNLFYYYIMNSSTEYIKTETQVVTYKNGKKQVHGMEYNKINRNGEPVMIKGDRWTNKKHKRFRWMNPLYIDSRSKSKSKTRKQKSSLNLVPSRGMPIFNGKKAYRKSKKARFMNKK